MVMDADELLREYAAGRRRFDGVSLFAADLSGAKLPDNLVKDAASAN